MNENKIKMPKNLDIEIGNPNQVFWEDMLKKSEDAIVTNERSTEMHILISNYARQRVAEEKAKFDKINKEMNK